MATILQFHASERASSGARPGADAVRHQATVIMFPGIRIDRGGEAAATPNAIGSADRGKPSLCD